MNKTFENLLNKLEDPNYQGGSYDLPKNASFLEKTKFNLCQKILAHQQDNHLNIKQISKKIQLSQAETEDILHCRIDKITLDRLIVYADKLFTNLELGIKI